MRRLKNGIGVYKRCGSSAVYRYIRIKPDNRKVYSVICSNPDCRVHTQFFYDKDVALSVWNEELQKGN